MNMEERGASFQQRDDYLDDIQSEALMTARGPFDVKVTPQPADDPAAGPFGRMFLDKKYHGDLDATANGQMLAAGTAVKGSAGYVALELVNGTLHGRRGSFMLQHSGSMTKGAVTGLSVTVVPDSGTEELSGLAGTLQITIAPDGKHTYEFEYRLDGR
jgi:hypothetical protein